MNRHYGIAAILFGTALLTACVGPNPDACEESALGEDGACASGAGGKADDTLAAPTGRTLTILVSLKHSNFRGAGSWQSREAAVVDRLIVQAVRWAGKKENPRVLVIQDDGHYGEAAGDCEMVADTIKKYGMDVTLGWDQRPVDAAQNARVITKADLSVDIETGGLRYDVAWICNPGWPLNMTATGMAALRKFSSLGGGLVFEGDDMSQALPTKVRYYGETDIVRTEDLTSLHFLNNGTSACGYRTDNNLGAGYKLTLDESVAHPVTKGLAGLELVYRDDIDTTSATEKAGVKVLAQAKFEYPSCNLAARPVIVAYDPAPAAAPAPAAR